MNLRSIAGTSVLSLLLGLPPGAAASLSPNHLPPGAAPPPDLQARRTANASTTALVPSLTFSNAQFAAGGVALRNRPAGGISISGVVAPVQAAYLYWAVITSGAPTAPDQSIYLTRLDPGSPPATLSLSGTAVGSGDTPCWPSCNDSGVVITVFRATVPTTLANGNGTYQVTLLSGAAGDTNSADPESEYNLPLMEGATLIEIGTGNNTVAIYDAGLAGTLFFSNPGYSYSLALPVTATGTSAVFDETGADGQGYFGAKTTTINGLAIAGPGSQATDGDWDGRAGLPSPQLWDNAAHDITAAVPAGTTTLDVTVANPGSNDALTAGVNIISLAGGSVAVAAPPRR